MNRPNASISMNNSPVSRFVSVMLMCWALLPAGTLLAQEGLSDLVYTVGTTISRDGTHWAYILWQPTSPDLLAGQSFAVYSKPGDANASAPFTRRSIVQLQTDPQVIAGLMSRAAYAGEDVARLMSDLDNLFATLLVTNNLPPSAALNPAERLSAVIRGSISKPEHYQNLMLLAKNHPAVSLSLGIAAAEQIPVGLTTFEVRAYDRSSDQDLAVMGRVTVQAGAPTVLPAPGRPVPVPDLSAKGHLNLRFRWGTPDSLRRLSLLQFGYNLYRIQQPHAVEKGWNLSPPSGALLRSMIATNAPWVKRVNNLPIVPSQRFTLTEAENIGPSGDPETIFIADDDGRFRPGYFNQGYTNGAKFYYYAAARDILGRDGTLSEGTLATVCERQPPFTPMHLSVRNETYNTNKLALRLTWDQVTNHYTQVTTNPISGAVFNMKYGVASNYWVYRWQSPDEMFRFANDPASHLVAVLPHVPGTTSQTLTDNGAGAPAAPADLGKTFWYTVRAGDSGGVCGTNLSAHSAPVFGVLRDRIGPVVPNATILTHCPQPQAKFVSARIENGTIDPERYTWKIECDRGATAIEWAEFYVYQNGTWALLDRKEFRGKETKVSTWFIGQRNSSYNFSCVVGWRRCDQRSAPATSGMVSSTISSLDHQLVGFNGSVISTMQSVRNGDSCCGHVQEDPNTGQIVFPIINIPPTPTSKEWRLYQQIDLGPFTLVGQGIFTNAVTPIDYMEDVLPVQGGTVCYYLQVLDEHGNESPRQLIGCFLSIPKNKHQLPAPVLGPIIAAGNEKSPKMELRWFCPPPGVDRFEVCVAGYPTEPPTNSGEFSSFLAYSNRVPGVAAVTNLNGEVLTNLVFHILRTPRVGGEFSGLGGQFMIPATVVQGNTYAVYVKAINQFGQSSEPSDTQVFTWSPVKTPTPEVPWPARIAPRTNADFAGVAAFMTPANNGNNFWTDTKGCGVWIAYTTNVIMAPVHQEETILYRCGEDVNSWVLTNLLGARILPVALYRVQVPSEKFPVVSSNVVQVSPLLEKIAFEQRVDDGVTNVFMLDPFVGTVWWQDANGPHLSLVLRDTHPIFTKAKYKYILVRFKPNGEIDQLIPTNEVEVP